MQSLRNSTATELDKLIAQLKQGLAEVDKNQDKLLSGQTVQISELLSLAVDGVDFDLNSGAFSTSNLHKMVKIKYSVIVSLFRVSPDNTN
jgi:hypothetical protein